ncbi:integrin alpha-PS3-like isoform X2 [Palaemon carinicauda]
MAGACYWRNMLDDWDTPHISVPLKDARWPDFGCWSGYPAQFGFSAHLPDKEKKMVFGAPGTCSWRGTLSFLKDGWGLWNMFTSVNISTPHTDRSSRNGYSTTSGKFFNKDQLLFASGAPGGSSMHGEVFIYEFSGSNLVKRDSKNGDQLGENFGASLVSADVNGDGLSDLVVGSPTFSEDNKPDIGRIQVFHGTKNGLSKSSSHSGSERAMARFGTTLASPGDINRDGYEDIAVGAPWEVEGKGAVYIYLGSSDGLWKKFAQRLVPEDFPQHLNLRGFGMSISRATDIDGNSYPDLAIGSVLSGHAMVLMSRAVASLRGLLSSYPRGLELEASRLKVTACVEYDGFEVPRTVDVLGNIMLDVGHSPHRVSFESSGEANMKFNISVTKSKTNCMTFNLEVQNTKMNPSQPISVMFDYAIEEIPGSRLTQPKTNPVEKHSTTLSVPILTDCSDNGDIVCQINMKVSASFVVSRDYPTLVIGLVKTRELQISVTNSGESVFLPNITIKVPEPFALYSPTSHSCEFVKEKIRSEMVCQLMNPIKRQDKDVLNVTIDANGVTDSASKLTVEVNATGDGVEINPSDNIRMIEAHLIAVGFLELQGYSPGEHVFYSRLAEDKINTTVDTSSLTHHYKVVKSGPTPLGSVEISVDVPVKFIGHADFLTIQQPKTNFMDQPFICTTEEVPLMTERPGDGGDISGLEDSGVVLQNATEVKLLSCGGNGVVCSRVKCLINSWPGGTHAASLALELNVNFTALAGHINAAAGAIVETDAIASVVSINQDLTFYGRNTSGVFIETRLIPLSVAERRVALWILLLAILGGLFLLFLLVLLLYKKGFFRRKKREEMKVERERWLSQRRPEQTPEASGISDS